jgi:hypothetical protein
MSAVEDGLSSINDAVDQGLRAIDPSAGSKASAKASEAANLAQLEALEYQKERDALPSAYRDKALEGLGGFYGLNDSNYMQNLMESPMYQQAIQQGEDAVMRNANATGGFRSGNVQQALMNNPMQINNQYMQGLQSLAGAPTNANAIAQQYNTIGGTQAQGIIGQAQSQQAGWNNAIQTGAALYAAFSDARLKENVVSLGNHNGVNLYQWDWNKRAYEDLGLKGSSVGVMAHEMDDDVLSVHESGYLMVDYDKVGNNG